MKFSEMVTILYQYRFIASGSYQSERTFSKWSASSFKYDYKDEVIFFENLLIIFCSKNMKSLEEGSYLK